MEIFKVIQGCKDALRKWQEEIEPVLLQLGLVPNRADNCFYSGIIGNSPVMVARASDDLLVAASRANYEVLLNAMYKKWTMHDKGLAKFFFGIRITQSID